MQEAFRRFLGGDKVGVFPVPDALGEAVRLAGRGRPDQVITGQICFQGIPQAEVEGVAGLRFDIHADDIEPSKVKAHAGAAGPAE